MTYAVAWLLIAPSGPTDRLMGSPPSDADVQSPIEHARQRVVTGVRSYEKYPSNPEFPFKSGPVSELALSDSGPRFPTSVLAAARMGTPAPLRVAFGFRFRSSNDDRSRRPRLRRARRLKGDTSNRPFEWALEIRARNDASKLRGSLSSRSVGAH